MNWRKWCDEFLLAGKGVLLATRERRFWVGFIIAFLVFGNFDEPFGWGNVQI